MKNHIAGLLVLIVSTSLHAESDQAFLARHLTIQVHRDANSALTIEHDFGGESQRTLSAIEELQVFGPSTELGDSIRDRALVLLQANARVLARIAKIDADKPGNLAIAGKLIKAAGEEAKAGDKIDAGLNVVGRIIAEVDKSDAIEAYVNRKYDLYRLSLELGQLAAQDTEFDSAAPLYGFGFGYVPGKHGGVEVNYLEPGQGAIQGGLVVGDEVVALDGNPVTPANIPHAQSPTRGRRNSIAMVKVLNQKGESRMLKLKRSYPSQPIVVRPNLNFSWNGIYKNELLFLSNTSQTDLTNCTLLIGLGCENGKVLRHVHHITSWKAGTDRCIAYPRTGDYALTFGTDNPNSIQVTAWSNEAYQDREFSYSDRDADIESYCKNLTFSGQVLSPYNNFFGSGPRGLEISFKGLSRIPVNETIVTMRTGRLAAKSVRFTSDKDWDSGWLGEKTLRSQHFSFSPGIVEVELHFRNSGYVKKLTWNFTE